LKLLRLLCAAALLAAAVPAAAQPDRNLGISLLTFAPGEIYWQRFGHNALLVRDYDAGSAIVYNYGIFDFHQKNFFLNFARGRMLYRLGTDSLERTLWAYESEGRWALEQPLNLSAAQRTALADYLRWNALPENAEYRYDYFVENCSTRVRDALDQVLHGELRRQLESKPAGVSYRWEAVRLMWPDRLPGLAMDAALGPAADAPLNVWQQGFVPMALMEGVRAVRVSDESGQPVPLVLSERRLTEGSLPQEPAAPPDLRLPFLLLGLGLAALLLVLERRAWVVFAATAGAFELVCGLLGLAIAAIWGLTEHWAGFRNPTLLLMNPLCMLLAPAWLRREPSNLRRWLVLLVALIALISLPLALAGIGAAKLHWIALLLPPHFALAYLEFRRRP
jgi:hypothetical protein